jgi:hypothetical protein
MGQDGRPSPFLGPFATPFDLDDPRAIYSPPAKRHASFHLSFAAEEQRRECHTCFSKENQVQTYMHVKIKFHPYSDI